jgi:hypothetical protein
MKNMVTYAKAGLRQSKRRAKQSLVPSTVSNTKRPRISSTKTDLSYDPKLKTIKKKEIDTEVGDDESADGTVVEYSWPTEPYPFIRSKTHEYYGQIHLSMLSCERKRLLNIRHGDTIFLSNGNGKLLFCRVNRFASRISAAENYRNTDGDVKVEGYWLLHRKDLVKHFGNAITPDSHKFIGTLLRNELVLTNSSAALGIANIEGNVRILYLQPEQSLPAEILPNTYICRYTLDIDTARRTLEWGAITDSYLDIPNVDNYEEEIDMEFPNLESSSFQYTEVDDSSDTTSSMDDISKVLIREGEGATLRTEIRVGPKFQAFVKPFSGSPIVKSRQPVLLHKANAIADDELYQFLTSVANVHNEYLRRNMITRDDPYSPLPQSVVETVLQEIPDDRLLTCSSISTSSMLAGKRCKLMKECDPDVLLEILALHNYDTSSALSAIQRDLNQISVGWARSEKDIFDDAYRRNKGSLRKIAKIIAPLKTMKDVIDYFYRFKVSDQFRKFQDKKRSIAVRMVECIEATKYHEALTSPSNNGNISSIGSVGSACNGEPIEKSSHWSEKSVASIAVSRDDRVQAAKQLLLDVKDQVGSKTMAEVASVIRQLQERYEIDGRNSLFKLLDGQPELQRRLLQFLPKHF